MVEINYNSKCETADLAGRTLCEVRDQFKGKLAIPNKARAWLNGNKISESAEIDTVLRQNDSISFIVGKSRGVFIIAGALALALIVTGSVFAFGFSNGSTSLNATAKNSNFADVVQDADYHNISWTETGLTKNTISGPHSIFDIIPANGHTGDLQLTVTLANTNELIKYYRALSLKLQLVNTSDNSTIDINGDGLGNSNDWVLLTLDNAWVRISAQGSANMTVRLAGGYYLSNVVPRSGQGGSASPQLFCEIAQ